MTRIRHQKAKAPAARIWPTSLPFQLTNFGCSRASSAFYQFQDKAPSAAPWLAGEAACRSLPELAVLACVLIALGQSRRRFHA